MALKDWEKNGKTLWFNKKNNDAIQIIRYVAIHYNHKPDLIKYVVYVGKNKDKRFKTKQQALDYARNYRMKH